MFTQKDKQIISELAKRYAAIAMEEENRSRAKRMRNINSLRPDRPIVLIDEVPWHEMNFDGLLDLQCEDDFARNMEWHFREKLYRWKYMRADMVAEDAYYVYKSSDNTGFGDNVLEDIIATDSSNHIVSHHYIDSLDTEEKLDMLHAPKLTAYPEQDKRNVEMAEELLGGILPVRLRGWNYGFAPWDLISRLRGVETILYDMVDRPEFLHKIIARLTDFGLAEMLQLEELGLLDYNISSLHCTPPQVDGLPAKDYDGGKVRLKDTWFRGTAQMFSTVSPAMHQEFEFDYMQKLFEKCGYVYYGCCEPLDNKIDLLRKIPNMRKLGVSPWSNPAVCAEQMRGDYVFARKPNPAMVAIDINRDALVSEIEETIKVCMQHGCPYEFVLKDISTVGYKPQRLFEWNKIVQETIDKYYA